MARSSSSPVWSAYRRVRACAPFVGLLPRYDPAPTSRAEGRAATRSSTPRLCPRQLELARELDPRLVTDDLAARFALP